MKPTDAPPSTQSINRAASSRACAGVSAGKRRTVAESVGGRSGMVASVP